MALKRVIAAAAFALLNDSVKAEYKQVGEEYHLDVEGEDYTHVQQKKNIAEQHRRTAEAKVEELQNTLDEIRRGNIPKADVEALEQSHRDRFTALEAKSKARETALIGALTTQSVTSRAMAIAKEISNTPDLLAPVLASRMVLDEVDGNFILKVKDSKGVAGVMSVDDLVAEVKNDARYAAVILGGKGSGGGANGGDGGGAGGGGGKGKKLSEMNDAERVAFYRRDPEGFQRAKAEQKQ